MSDEPVSKHPVRSTLLEIVAAKEWPELQEVPPESEEHWSLRRIFDFADLAVRRLSETPASLIAVRSLDALNDPMVQALANLNAFRQSRELAQLQQATNDLDARAFTALGAIPSVSSLGTVQDLGAAADRFRSQAGAYLANLAADRERLTLENKKLEERIAEQASQITTLSETVVQQKADAQATTAEVKRDYAKAEQELRKEFQNQLDKQIADNLAFVAEQKAVMEGLRGSTETSGKALLDELTAKRDKAAEIVQIVGNIGVTGNYQNIAASEGEAANTWRRITFGVFLAAAFFGVYTLVEFGKESITWQPALVRMVFAFVIASIAVYTSKESARHRTNADTAKRTELELASLGPFIESLPPEKRNEIREKLTDRYFGNRVEPHTVEPAIAPKDVLELAEKALNTAKEMAKR